MPTKKIPTPAECLQVIDETEVRRVEEVENQIAVEVRKQYTSYGSIVTVPVTAVNERIAAEVQKRCGTSGWTANFKTSGGNDDGNAGRNSSAGTTVFTLKCYVEYNGGSYRD